MFKSSLRALHIAGTAIALLGVSACTQPGFDAKVARFQSMPAPQGQSYAIKAADARYANSLEFSQYASLVGRKLSGLGYQPAASADNASLVVTMGFGVDKGKDRQRISYDPWYSNYGYGYGYGPGWRHGYPYYGYGRHHGYRWGFYDPFFDSGYGGVEHYTVYTSDLELKIDTKSENKRVFEGKAQALSTTNNLTYLVPNLVEAMFTGFPGNSGETLKITVPPPPKVKTSRN